MPPTSRRATLLLLCAMAACGTVHAAGVAPLHRVDSVTSMGDVVAIRTDGLAVAQVGEALRLVDAQGGTYPFADAAMRTLSDHGVHPRIVAMAPVSTGAQTCAFRPNDLVVGVPGSDGGSESLAALDAQGRVAPWRSSIPDGTVLSAAFDSVGRFGLSLLVLVRRDDGAAVEEFDCRGRRTEVVAGIAGAQPAIAVLPGEGAAIVATAGGLISVTPDGGATPVRVDGWSSTVRSAVTGVVAIPGGFTQSTGLVDVAAEHGLLQAHADDLAAAGLRDADLLAATGSPAELVAVHCESGRCSAHTVARGGADGGGVTGRPAVLPTKVGGDVVLPRDADGPGWTTLGVAGAGVATLVIPGVIGLWRRRRQAAELEKRFFDDDPAEPCDQR